MPDGVEHEVRVEPLAARRLQMGAVAPVDGDRHVERLSLLEDRVEVAAREIDTAVVGGQHHADMTEFSDGPFELLDRGTDVLRCERGGALEAIGRSAAE